MPSFLNPDPVILAFLGLKQVVYLEVLVLFGLLRAALCRGPARRAALAGLVLAIVFVAAKLLPPVYGIAEGPLFRLGGWVRVAVGGMAAPLICSGLYLAAAVLPGRRCWGLDLLHGAWFAALLGLWGYTVWS